jgi:SEC-C motif-containing protein
VSSKGKSTAVVYAECCGRFIEGGAAAPDAASLMRSRYSAFVLEREAYLLSCWHPSYRPASIAFEPGVKWLGLDVRAHTSTDTDRAVVEFVARSKSPGAAALRLHERSRFVREAGQWLYLDGDQL